MQYIIGVGLMILGGVLTAVTGFMPLVAVLLVGVVLFASVTTQDAFCDYRIVNTNEVLVRVRSYLCFLPFTIVSSVLTLGRASLIIPYKERYFKVLEVDQPEPKHVELSRNAYMAIRNRQRQNIVR